MDWANERWVRLYTRDTTTWKMLDWRARTVLMHLLRKVDRAGVLEVGDTGTMGLAAVLELPLEVVEPGIERLLHPRLRVIVETPTAYVLPHFLDAQEAVQTTNHRSAEYRARKRDFALAAAKPAIAELVRLPAPAPARIGDDVTARDGAVTKRDASITRGHATPRVLDLDTSDRVDLPADTDPTITSIVTKRDDDITPSDEPITRGRLDDFVHFRFGRSCRRCRGRLCPREVLAHRRQLGHREDIGRRWRLRAGWDRARGGREISWIGSDRSDEL